VRVARTDLQARYAGSLIGVAWAVFYPIVLLCIYAVIYLLIFQVRPTYMTPVMYILYMFSGLVPFLMVGESLSSGVASVVGNKAVLNNTVFPIELAPVKPVLLSQGVATVGFTLIVVVAAAHRLLNWTVLLLPILWLFQLLFLIGLNWMLSIIHVVFRDLQYLVSLGLFIVLVSSPIAYTQEMIPESLKIFMFMNPFSYFIVAFQQILVLGEPPPTWQWLVLVLLSFGMFVLGGWIFAGGKRALIDYV
jgi:lipopolysaccharide transport system permease protein